MDAYYRIMKLNLKDKKERDVIRVLIHCCQQEKTYNPYYTLVLQQFLNQHHSHVITFQYALWDAFKAMENQGKEHLLQTSHLASMVSDLCLEEHIPLTVFKV